MTKAEGQIRIDGVAVGEASINLLGPSMQLSVKYALCNTVTGEKFGAGNRNANWSDETMSRLAALVESMERDVIEDVFLSPQDATSVEVPSNYAEDGVPGL